MNKYSLTTLFQKLVTFTDWVSKNLTWALSMLDSSQSYWLFWKFISLKCTYIDLWSNSVFSEFFKKIYASRCSFMTKIMKWEPVVVLCGPFRHTWILIQNVLRAILNFFFDSFNLWRLVTPLNCLGKEWNKKSNMGKEFIDRETKVSRKPLHLSNVPSVIDPEQIKWAPRLWIQSINSSKKQRLPAHIW